MDFQGNSAIFVGTIICVESIHKICDIFSVEGLVMYMYPLCGYHGFIEKKMSENFFAFFIKKTRPHKITTHAIRFVLIRLILIGSYATNRIPCFIG